MTRQKIREAQEINSLQGGCDIADIRDVIDELIALQNLGWTTLETDVYNSFGEDNFTISVSRKRDETDEEMTARQERQLAYEDHQKAEYQRLKAIYG